MRTLGFAGVMIGAALLASAASARPDSAPRLDYGPYDHAQDPRTGMHAGRWSHDWSEPAGWDGPDDDDDPDAFIDDGVTLGGVWHGTWTGSYDGGPVRQYSGEFRGDYDGPARRGPPSRDVYRDDRPPAFGYRGGYYYPAPVATTIVIQSAPAVTTTTYVDEVASAWRPRPAHKWKRKIVRRCACK